MTELLWHGKYRDGERVLPDRTPRVLVTDEIADPCMEASSASDDSAWRNLLIGGGTREVLPSLLPALAGRVSFAYMDPPFATGADYTVAIPLLGTNGAGDASPRQVARVAYRDTWGPGLDGYLQWFFETATLLRDLLADDGAIVVHCDWRADAQLRLILDEVFGTGNFRNAIAWAYRSGGASRHESLARKHDTLLLYARSSRFAIRPQIERQYLGKPFIGSRRDASGRHYVDTLLRDVLDGELTLVREGQLVRRSVRPVLNVSRERLGYPTQKPLGLLELLIEMATDAGALVLDCCCGSGTTPAAAAITGRRWIAADSSPLALAVTRARLLSLPTARPFAVQRAIATDGEAICEPAAPGATLHVSARVTSSPTAGRAPAPRPRAASPATPSRASREDGGQEHRVDGDVACQAPGSEPRLATTRVDCAPDTALSRPPTSASSAVPFSVTLSVDGLTLPERELPEGIASSGPASGCDWIAYWLVDWAYAGDVFRIHDWSGRPRGAGPPPATLTHADAHPGRHTIAVRAIDLFGGVTTATLDVEL